MVSTVTEPGRQPLARAETKQRDFGDGSSEKGRHLMAVWPSRTTPPPYSLFLWAGRSSSTPTSINRRIISLVISTCLCNNTCCSLSRQPGCREYRPGAHGVVPRKLHCTGEVDTIPPASSVDGIPTRLQRQHSIQSGPIIAVVNSDIGVSQPMGMHDSDGTQ